MHLPRGIVAAGWRLVDAAMALALLVMIGLVFANVVLRYGFASGILGSVELSRLLFVWLVMLGAVACLRHHEHLALGDLAETLLPRARLLLRRFVNAVIFGCSVMLFLGSYKQVFANWANISPMSGVPVGVFYLAGAVGGILMAAIALLRFFTPASAVPDDSGDALP